MLLYFHFFLLNLIFIIGKIDLKESSQKIKKQHPKTVNIIFIKDLYNLNNQARIHSLIMLSVADWKSTFGGSDLKEGQFWEINSVKYYSL